ncbi:MAG: hypothetical protein OEY33_01615 [Bdellovibrionales bacterium]|jgi:hypothetical protein|nr:hypothetical protein [Bdellovibrionales bacterium]
MKKRKIDLSDESGQAIFEFIVFIPFYLVFLVVFLTVAGAVNGSINQQKSTRGYFFYSVKNDSTVPFKKDLEELGKNGISMVGSYSFGWQRSARGATPIAPCYKIPSILGDSVEEECEDPMNSGTREAKYVRVFTTFGVCSSSYTLNQADGSFLWDSLAGNSRISSSCTLR